MNKNNYRTCIGGILLLAAGIISIVIQLISFAITVISYGGSLSNDIASLYIQNLITTIVTNLPIVVLGVVLLLKKRGVITVLCSIMLALNLLTLLSGILSIGDPDAAKGTLASWLKLIFTTLTNATLVALSVVSVNPQPNSLKKLWFLPGVCYGLYAISNIVFTINVTLSASGSYLDPSYIIGFVIGTIIGSLPVYGLYTAGYFMTGHWLANPYKKGYQPQQAQPQYDEQTMQVLNYYKWQYESGAISWEQYNAAIQPYLNQYNK